VLKPKLEETSAAKYKEAEQEFLGEIGVMKQLRHPNLVSLLGVCTAGSPTFMILEFLKGGSLEDWLPENGPRLKPERLTHLLHQVALGFLALEEAMIIHRDLAARNVLIDEYQRIKVSGYKG
jgi:serine/threonine protein kinase